MTRTYGPMIGRLVRHDGEREASGVAWLDGHGVDRVRITVTRWPLPGFDVGFHRLTLGLPLWAADGATATDRVDVELVAMGLVWRLPRPSRSPLARPMWTVRPVVGAYEPLWLGVIPIDDERLRLGWQRRGGDWQHVGDLLLPRGTPEHELWGASHSA